MSTSSNDMPSDEQLILDVKNHTCHSAFSELVERHANRFRRIAFRYVNSIETAEDIVQTAFLGLWHKPHQWNENKQTRFTTWFHRIIVNRCIDYVRKYSPLPLLDGIELADNEALPDEQFTQHEHSTLLKHTIQHLPHNMQLAINLSFYDAVPNKEAAKMMNLTLKSYQSLVMRAKKTLKDDIQKQLNTPSPQHQNLNLGAL